MAARLTLGLVLLLAAYGPVNAQDGTDVPFITTPDNVTLAMLRLAGVKRGDHVIDLGSGDGRIVITAAKRFGATGLGVEIVPDLVTQSRANAERAGVALQARFAEQDLFKTELDAASVITMYLLPEVNLQLRPRLLNLKPGTRIVSHDWDMGDWPSDQTLTLDVPDKPVGREKLSRLHLWVVPARVEGLWCAAHGPALRLAQRYQQLSGTAQGASRQWSLHGRIHGADVRLIGAAGAGLAARWDAGTLRVREARGAWRGLAGQALRHSNGERC